MLATFEVVVIRGDQTSPGLSSTPEVTAPHFWAIGEWAGSGFGSAERCGRGQSDCAVSIVEWFSHVPRNGCAIRATGDQVTVVGVLQPSTLLQRRHFGVSLGSVGAACPVRRLSRW